MTRLGRYSVRFKRHLKTSRNIRRSRGSVRTRCRQISTLREQGRDRRDCRVARCRQKDLDVTLANGMLTVRGEKKTERDEQDKDKNWHVVERSYGSFSRAIPLPFDPDPAKVEAKFDKGVLHIHLPKPAEVAKKQQKIEIKKA